MNSKALRLVLLVPILLALFSFLQSLSPIHSPLTQLAMTPPAGFGTIMLALVWIIYLSGYKYGRKLLLIIGILSLALTLTIIASHFLNFTFRFESLLVPAPRSNTPFLLNLSFMFLACYIVQTLAYWLPRTKLIVNIMLGVILFMVLLSIFGHFYQLSGIPQEALLLPMPFGAIIGFLVLILVIFSYTNHMDRLYLNTEILVSFMAMFIAILGANVVIYRNIHSTANALIRIDETRQILIDTYNVNYYLNIAQTEAQTYGASTNPAYISLYQNNRQSYYKAISQVELESGGLNTKSIGQPIRTIANLGGQVISIGDSIVGEQHTLSSMAQASADEKMNNDMGQVGQQIKGLSLGYTSQLNVLTLQEVSGAKGIMLGVSIASALSVLFIIFTPLFIRQTIQKLAIAHDRLGDSNRLLYDEKSRAEAILASISDGLFAVDTHKVITIFNQAAEDMTGIQREAALGKRYEEVTRFLSTEQDKTFDFTNKALQGITSYLTHNVTLSRSDEQKLDVQISASPIKNKSGSVVGAIVVFRDRSHEQELETAKDEFVSLASHQLRTPATATKQFLAMFLQGYAGNIDDRQRFFLQEAYDNNEQGIHIIEDLLNITRLESNTLKVVKEKIELGQFLKTNVQQHEVFARKSKQNIHLITPSKPIEMETEVSLLEMAVDNLITNALKYSDEGDDITVRLTAGDDRIAIAVEDSGIGMKEEDIPKLFQRFTRLDDPQKQYVSGTGIGLYLVKKIVKRLRGTIKVESEYGKGSTFTLEFKPSE